MMPSGKSRHHPAVVGTTNLILSVLLVACSAPDSETASHGPEVERYPGGAIHYCYDTLARRYLECDTLAVWDPWADDAGYPFTRVPYVHGLGSSLFAVDPRNCQVVEVDMTGRVLNIIGRSGAGPGEFYLPQQIAFCADTLWVSDVRNVRLSAYHRSGTAIRDIRWPVHGGDQGEFDVLPDGRIVHLSTGRYQPESGSRSMYLFAWDPVTTRTDTLAGMSQDLARDIQLGIVLPDGRNSMITLMEVEPLFAPSIRWHVSDRSMLIIATSLDYQVDFYDLQGNLHRRLTAPTPDLRVTPTVRRWWINEGFSESNFSRIGQNASWEFTGEGLENWPVAERRQAVIGIKKDPLENIWILSATNNINNNCIDIYNNNLIYIGSYMNSSLPESFLSDGTAIIRHDNDDQALFFFVTITDEISHN